MDVLAVHEAAVPEAGSRGPSQLDGHANGMEHSNGADNKFQKAISSWRSE